MNKFDDMFVITCRYEKFTLNGKEWINWFVVDSDPCTEDEAKQKIKKIKSDFEFIDKKTKLKHEYSIKPYNEYIAERKEIAKDAKKFTKEYEKYLKSDEYKELQKKKRQANKELKERQKKYMEEHMI